MLNLNLWHYESDLFKFDDYKKRDIFIQKIIKKYLNEKTDYIVI